MGEGNGRRPEIDELTGSASFRQYYYLKEELEAFCRQKGLPRKGAKADIADRIARYLDGVEECREKMEVRRTRAERISDDAVIEEGIVFSEELRAYFKERLGVKFTFNVPFQKWLKSNAGKTFGDAVRAYPSVKASAKKDIDPQFEYNTYIRDFFADNADKSLAEAIRCWRYKKGRKGSHAYERGDLAALETEE